MAWTNLAVLGIGGIMLSIPILLHLLMQPKPKLLAFPALRFVKEIRQSNRSRMRVRHFLLLLLRCLLIALVTLALAGPSVASNEFGNWLTLGGIGFSGLIIAVVLAAAFWSASRNWVLISILAAALIGHLAYGGWSAAKLLGSESAQLLGDSGAPVAGLVIIDTSPRMTYVAENSTRIDVAKEMAEWLVGQLPPDSRISVMASDRDRPFFSVDVSAAKKRISTLDTTYQIVPIPETLDKGLDLLEQAEEQRKEIYILTDLTVESWVAENGEEIARRLNDNKDISVFLIDVGIESPSNFQLMLPKLSGENITQSGGLQLTTELVRVGNAAQRTVRLRIEKPDPSKPQILDGKTVLPDNYWERSLTVDVRANQNAVVPFKFDDDLPAGVHHGQVEVIGEDGLAIDDRRFFTIQVRPTWKTLVVRPEDVSWKNLKAILAPGEDITPGRSFYDCNVIDQKEIDRENFSDYKLIVLLDPKPIQPATWSKLRDFVRGGGGLGVFLGHHAAKGAAIDESFTSEAAVEVLGGKLTFQWRRPDGNLFLSPDNLAHPIFKEFRELETSIPWNYFPVFFHWGVEPDENPNEHPTQTLTNFGNGRPAMIERSLGSGRAITMLTPITDPTRPEGRDPWNFLFISDPMPWPNWLLVDQICSYLVQSNAETLNLTIGQTASLKNDRETQPLSYRVFTPREEQTPTTLNVDKNEIRYRFTDTPGQYRFKGAFEKEAVLRGFSVNVPDEVSNLTRLEPDQLDLVLGAQRYQLAREKNDIQRQQGTTRRGKEFYPLLVIMLMVILGVEHLMSNRFYQSN